MTRFYSDAPRLYTERKGPACETEVAYTEVKEWPWGQPGSLGRRRDTGLRRQRRLVSPLPFESAYNDIENYSVELRSSAPSMPVHVLRISL